MNVHSALRHVAPGGHFAFIDLFADPGYYPEPGAIDTAIAESGGTITEHTPLAALLPLPFPLKHKRVLGHAVLIAGTRTH